MFRSLIFLVILHFFTIVSTRADSVATRITDHGRTMIIQILPPEKGKAKLTSLDVTFRHRMRYRYPDGHQKIFKWNNAGVTGLKFRYDHGIKPEVETEKVVTVTYQIKGKSTATRTIRAFYSNFWYTCSDIKLSDKLFDSESSAMQEARKKRVKNPMFYSSRKPLEIQGPINTIIMWGNQILYKSRLYAGSFY